ncbi:MAG: flavodoxin-dependent (E)-4-hydroxy-3-methylbut-2-enyl-diphosphate synthase [Saccharofermentans sp.]|nr:flavodoxin-dependent (E)-4-hydroxy-3-methylbut-2-enyl-diphosphate synthase [Mageeibacillus sp.]MCI1263427.1 flavodoxin-dependent (E)-4-hydroxy-3-methylbut-2-enyl-diphosphate synthase [Saccharofermentans sp.]MCI1274880.1 flavodoxin-dependent (E)-4-hydroxy-3-methylbut-2-enyl-diphosphate synthase [Saccharofermentans sp.]MCI1769098.1 flavodoxin-dependent (E)-4-hydroxy-3-methylbut-2-enyl-diphosphate synthase [Mageeibacillus sp.]MCI2044090.1 flavodoxin-dependent (E)-4-hydroxy-3-methylbut-2-enyl-di
MTKKVMIGNVQVGGGASVKIQSMNNTDTRDARATLEQIARLKDAGCDITRVAVPDMEAAMSLKQITSESPIPVVADIHFDYRLAIKACENGAAKIRINPGNIGGIDNIAAVVKCCRERDIPIRVGVNSGSISREILAKYGEVNAEAMTESALNAIRQISDMDYDNIVISIKSSSPKLTIDTYRILSKSCDYPLHVGVTEAGTVKEGVIKSAVGIGALLAEGIGDTIRVSLTGDPVDEVYAAVSILKALELREGGITFISCPTCGRTQVPLIELASEIERRVCRLPYNLKVAVMGCVVNGPGEARGCDIGLAGGVNEFLLFEKGEPIRKIPAGNVVEEFVSEVVKVGEQKKAD